MGSSTANRLGASRVGEAFALDESEFTVVTRRGDPLFDHRAALEPSRKLARSMRALGKQGAAIVVQDRGLGEDGRRILAVVDGRQRLGAVKLWNIWRAEDGDEPVKIRFVLYTGRDEASRREKIALNCRAKAPVFIDAMNAWEETEPHGFSDESVDDYCALSGTSRKTVDVWLAILRGHRDVVEAWKLGKNNGGISLRQAYDIVSKHGLDAQPRVLERLLSPREKAAAREATTRRLLPKRHVLALHEELEKEAQARAELGTDEPEVHVDGLVNPLDMLRLLAGDMSVLDKPCMADVRRLAVRAGILRQKKGKSNAETE